MVPERPAPALAAEAPARPVVAVRAAERRPSLTVGFSACEAARLPAPRPGVRVGAVLAVRSTVGDDTLAVRSAVEDDTLAVRSAVRDDVPAKRVWVRGELAACFAAREGSPLRADDRDGLPPARADMRASSARRRLLSFSRRKSMRRASRLTAITSTSTSSVRA